MPADPNASKKARLGFTAAAYGAAASRTRRREALDARDVAREAGGQAAGLGSRPRHSTVPVAADRARGARGMGRSRRRAGRARWRRDRGRRRRTGSRSAGMNQSGRETGSSPDTSVRGTISSTVQRGAEPPSWARRRSTVCPSRCRKAIPSPAGDQRGANDASSFVTRHELLPVARRGSRRRCRGSWSGSRR